VFNSKKEVKLSSKILEKCTFSISVFKLYPLPLPPEIENIYKKTFYGQYR